jgi:CheY-like chemotaxis protein
MTEPTYWRVLLVDDEPDSLNLIHDILTLNGARVHRATDGQQCLEMVAEVTPTMIVLDLAMPKMDGWEVLSQLHANPISASLPVVAVTAYHSPSVEKEARQSGFAAFLAKPIKSDTLLRTLAEVAAENAHSGAT